MLIEFQRDWRGIREGQVRDVPPGAAGVLVKRKIATPAGDKAPRRKRRGT